MNLVRRRVLRGLAAACVGGAVLSRGVWAAQAKPLVLGTATPGGGFEVYGRALAATLNKTDPGLQLTLRATRGSQENIPLLESGEIDLGLVEGTAAHEALLGIGRAPAALRIVAAMYPNPGMFVVRADSTYRSIDDLRGQRVAFGAQGSGLRVMARYVLDGLGFDVERDFTPMVLATAADGPMLVLSGDVAALWGAGSDWPGFRAVADGPAGARFLVPDAAGIERIRQKHDFLQPMTVPAGSYRGQPVALATVGVWAYIVASTTLEDEVVYRFVRALHRSEAELGARLPLARASTLANTARAVPRGEWLHPGARRYLRETGHRLTVS